MTGSYGYIRDRGRLMASAVIVVEHRRTTHTHTLLGSHVKKHTQDIPGMRSEEALPQVQERRQSRFYCSSVCGAGQQIVSM